jgi:hypothetical protein
MGTLGGRLSSLKVTRAREPGMLADGNGLYLQVTRANARSWIFRYFRNGKSHEMGLGSLKTVGLAAARLKAAECRGLLADGIDPIAARIAEHAQRAGRQSRLTRPSSNIHGAMRPGDKLPAYGMALDLGPIG